MIAMRRDEPHWLLNDADAKAYGQALQNALRHIPIGAAQKTIDFTTLAILAFNIETPRIGRSVQLAKTKGQANPRPGFGGPAQVFNFRPPPTPQPAASPVHATSPQTPVESGPGFVADGVDAPLGGA